MKYRLNYSHSTKNHHVYVCESTVPQKNGTRFWLPRFNNAHNPLVKTEMFISDAIREQPRNNRTKVRYAPLESDS